MGRYISPFTLLAVVSIVFLSLVIRIIVGSPTLLTIFVLLILTGLLILVLPIRYSILLPFCSVMLLGEGFNYGERLPVAPHVILMLLVLGVWLLRFRPNFFALMAQHRGISFFSILFMVAVLLGLANGVDAQFAKEDASPFLYFIVMYVVGATCFRHWPDLKAALQGLILIACLAIVKVLYIYLARPIVDWEGEWQAISYFGAGPLDVRIILRGADVFWPVGAVLLFSPLLLTRSISKQFRLLLPFAILGTGLFLAGTRSNWVGFGVGAIAELLILFGAGFLSPRRLVRVLLVFCLVAVLVGAAGRNPEYSLVQRVHDRFADPDQEHAIETRLAEARALLKSMGWHFLWGRGLGSEFIYFDYAQGGYVRASWSHNGFLFLYLKMGLLGLLGYGLLLAAALKKLWFLVLGTSDRKELALYLGLMGGLVCLNVLSLTVNKNFAVSGALFSGLVLGAIGSFTSASVGSKHRGVVRRGSNLRKQVPA